MSVIAQQPKKVSHGISSNLPLIWVCQICSYVLSFLNMVKCHLQKVVREAEFAAVRCSQSFDCVQIWQILTSSCLASRSTEYPWLWRISMLQHRQGWISGPCLALTIRYAPPPWNPKPGARLRHQWGLASYTSHRARGFAARQCFCNCFSSANRSTQRSLEIWLPSAWHETWDQDHPTLKKELDRFECFCRALCLLGWSSLTLLRLSQPTIWIAAVIENHRSCVTTAGDSRYKDL